MPLNCMDSSTPVQSYSRLDTPIARAHSTTSCLILLILGFIHLLDIILQVARRGIESCNAYHLTIQSDWISVSHVGSRKLERESFNADLEVELDGVDCLSTVASWDDTVNLTTGNNKRSWNRER